MVMPSNNTSSFSLISVKLTFKICLLRFFLTSIINWNLPGLPFNEFILNYLKRFFISWIRFFLMFDRFLPQSTIICKITNFRFFIKKVNKFYEDIEHKWTQYWNLWYFSIYLRPTVIGQPNLCPLFSKTQVVFKTLEIQKYYQSHKLLIFLIRDYGEDNQRPLISSVEWVQ